MLGNPIRWTQGDSLQLKDYFFGNYLLGLDRQIQARGDARHGFLVVLRHLLAFLNHPAAGSGDPAGAAE
jgi:hypothetical protein